MKRVNGTTELTRDQIKSTYFGGSAIPRMVEPVRKTREDLTPSAKYVAAEARKRMSERAAFDEPQELDEDVLLRLVRHVEMTEGEELSERERTSVVASLSASLEHYDVLSSLVENEDVNDIIVRSYDDVSVQIGRQNYQTDITFADRETYLSFVENLLKRAGKSCTLAQPVVDAAVDPRVRACVTHESFSPPGSGPMLTLRVARHSSITLEGLVVSELAPKIVLDYLAALSHSGLATILIAGEVGTGKTTLVKALATQIESTEAILIIEDTNEIALERPFTRTLLTREANTEGVGRISPAQAIRTGMRMAMNRIILGEMRDAEAAEAFVDVCASGHPGMSTIHARTARDAVSRLELFLSRAQPGVGVATVRRQIADAISIVVYLGLDKKQQKRRVMSVLEVNASSDGMVQLSPMFSYASEEGEAYWMRESGVSSFEEVLKPAGVTLPSVRTRITLDPEHIYRSRGI
jgi:pilus assembly protein CpaF